MQSKHAWPFRLFRLEHLSCDTIFTLYLFKQVIRVFQAPSSNCSLGLMHLHTPFGAATPFWGPWHAPTSTSRCGWKKGSAAEPLGLMAYKIGRWDLSQVYK
jgi:hypothetical protein